MKAEDNPRMILILAERLVNRGLLSSHSSFILPPSSSATLVAASQPKHLIQRQQNLEHDQNHDVPFHPQRAAGLNQAQKRLDRPRDQLQLAIEGREPLQNLEFVAQTGKQSLQIG